MTLTEHVRLNTPLGRHRFTCTPARPSHAPDCQGVEGVKHGVKGLSAARRDVTCHVPLMADVMEVLRGGMDNSHVFVPLCSAGGP